MGKKLIGHSILLNMSGSVTLVEGTFWTSRFIFGGQNVFRPVLLGILLVSHVAYVCASI